MTDAEIAAVAGLDDWLKRRAETLSERCTRRLKFNGYMTEDAVYREMLGEHRAYMAARSYLHGSRAHLQGQATTPNDSPAKGGDEGRER